MAKVNTHAAVRQIRTYVDKKFSNADCNNISIYLPGITTAALKELRKHYKDVRVELLGYVHFERKEKDKMVGLTTEDRLIKLAGLFNELERELRYFRDGTKTDRKAYQKVFANGNLGYVTSLATMLTDEDKFQRWLIFTTWRFTDFKVRAKEG